MSILKQADGLKPMIYMMLLQTKSWCVQLACTLTPHAFPFMSDTKRINCH